MSINYRAGALFAVAVVAVLALLMVRRRLPRRHARDLLTTVTGASFAAGLALGFDAAVTLSDRLSRYPGFPPSQRFVALNVTELAAAVLLLVIAFTSGLVGVRRGSGAATLSALLSTGMFFLVGVFAAVAAIVVIPGLVDIPPTILSPLAVALAAVVLGVVALARLLTMPFSQRIVVGRRRAQVFVIVAGLVLTAATAVASLRSTPAFHAIRDSLAISIFPEVTDPIVTGDGTVYVSEPTITIKGDTYAWDSLIRSSPFNQASEVKLRVNNSFVAAHRTDNSGFFTFDGVALRPGINHVTVTATGVYNWRRFSNPTTVTVYLVPDQLRAPVLDALPPVVARSTMLVSGSADPATRVNIHLAKTTVDHASGQRRDSGTDLPPILADPVTGRFASVVSLYPPGPTTVTAFATGHGGGRSPTSESAAVTYDPTSDVSVHGRVARRLSLTASPTSVHSEFEVRLPRDDERGIALLKGTLPAEDFFRLVFGRVTINKYDLALAYARTEPAVSVSSESLQVRGRGNPELETASVLTTLALRLDESDYLSLSDDSLTLIVHDYEIQSLDPEPASSDSNHSTWTGPMTSPTHGLTAHVRLDPFHNPLAVMRLHPFDLVTWPNSALIDILYAALGSFGLVWFLWLRHRFGPGQVIPEDVDQPLRRLLRWVVAFAFVPSVMDLARSVLYYLAGLQNLAALEPGLLKQLLVDPTRGAIAVSVAMGLAMTVLAGSTRWWRSSGGVLWLRTFVGAAAIASWLGGAGLLVALLWQSWFLFVDYRIGVWLLVAPATVFVGLSSVRIVYDAHDAANPSARRLPGRALALGIAALVLGALSWPVPTAFFTFAGFGGMDDIANAVTAAFWLAFVDNGYYVVALGTLVALWWQSRRYRSSSWPLRESLALLFFAYILTTTSPDLLGIPASLILALVVFRPLLLARPRDRAKLQEASERIARDRSSLLLSRTGDSPAPHSVKGPASGWPSAVAIRLAQLASQGTRRWRARSRVSAREAARLALAVGPYSSDWDNGVYAAKVGFMVALPWMAIYLTAFAFRPGELSTPAALLAVAFTFVREPFFWAAQAFFLGYFFSDIRGSSGLLKGLRLGLLYSLCALPLWLASIRTDSQAIAIVLRVCVEIAAVTVTGVVLDFRTTRDVLKGSFSWGGFARLTGIRNLTTLTSVLVASLSVGLATVVTGEFVNIATVALQAAGAPSPIGAGAQTSGGAPNPTAVHH